MMAIVPKSEGSSNRAKMIEKTRLMTMIKAPPTLFQRTAMTDLSLIEDNVLIKD